MSHYGMNRRGSALIICYTVIVVLAVLGSAYMSRTISENSLSARYSDSRFAFWVAEAGLAQAYHDWLEDSDYSGETAGFGDGSYTVTKDPDSPEVTSIGTYGTFQRTVRANFSRIPNPFENTISCGGNLTLWGAAARVEVYNTTQISGAYSQTKGSSGWFADKEEGVAEDETTIPIPDYNGNDTPDEFEDFVMFGQEVAASYPPDEVVYLQTDDTVNILPNEELIGKKVIFVEGSSPGEGDVNIIFDTTWQANQDLTVISTGNIVYLEPLQNPSNSRLSTISWGNYIEGSIFRSQHESVIFSHGNGLFVDILDWGSTTGNVIANGDISLAEILTYEKYYYSDKAYNGDMPPGFQYLSGESGQPQITDWQQP